MQFLFSFFRVLIEGNEQRYRLDFKEERRLWDAIERIYVLEPNQRTISNFTNIIGELKERLHRWTRGGQYGFLFDNADDSLSFSRFQTFNFHGWNDAPAVLEPLLFYVLHRASNEITDPTSSPPSRSSCSMRRGSSSRTRRFAITWCRRRRPGASTTPR
jgi:type IV secretory pathway VirB4 component